MRLFKALSLVFVLSLLLIGCQQQATPIVVEATPVAVEPTATVVESPTPLPPSPTSTPVPTSTPTPTPTPSPTPTPTFTPTPSPTVTPKPDKLEWLNPFAGQAEALPATCYTPEVQAVLQWAQEDPEGLVRAWIGYWDDYFQAHPGLMEQKRFDPEWYTWFFKNPQAFAALAQIGELPGLGALPVMPGQAGYVIVQFPVLLLGLANEYEYPDLGVTVFTACALIYDNDLATRVYSMEELEAMPTGKVYEYAEEKLLMRPDPENARPRWYLGEVAVAYAVHPDSWLNEVEPASGEVLIGGFTPGGGADEFRSVAVEVRITPGCYYFLWPEAIRQRKGVDPDCSLLGDLAQTMGAYVGMVLLKAEPAELMDVLTLQVEPLSTDVAEAGLGSDFYAMPRDSMSRDEWKAAINELMLDQALAVADLDPVLAQSRGVVRTLSLVALAWKEAQPGPDAPLCTARRALFHYKLRPGLLSPLCSLEEAAQSDYWISLDEEPLIFDGEPFLFSLEDLLARRQ